MTTSVDSRIKLSEKVKPLQQSGIRAVSRRCAEVKGVNLGQGVCDIPMQQSIKDAASRAINDNHNQYASNEGLYPLRKAIAEKVKSFNHIPVQSPSQVLVSHGSTGSYVCAIQTVFNPGDEVILFEPFYGYHKSLLELNGMTVKSIAMDIDFNINFDELRAIISDKTRGIVICTPCNPNGKVFSKDELLTIGDIARNHDLVIIADEIYEYITYPGYEHVSIASLEDHFERTITISGLSKTYNMTGWRLGYCTAPEHLIEKMALLHDLIYVCPPTPFQYAALEALSLDNQYYQHMRQDFLAKRDYVVNELRDMGFIVSDPQGAYYLMVDFSNLDFADDKAIVEHMLEHAKVAAVTGRSFFIDADKGKKLIRFCYALDEDKLQLAMQQLRKALA